MTCQRAQHRTAARSGCDQTTAARGERERRDDQTARQTHSATEHATDPRRGLLLLHNLDLVVTPLDHGGVVGVDQPCPGVQILDQLVVRLRRLDVGYTPT